MRKVLILYPSAVTACGIGTWIEALATTLAPRGWETWVGLAWGRRYHDPAKVEAFRPSLRTLRMDGRTGTEEGRIQAIERAIRAVRPDVVLLTVLDSAFEAVRRLRYQGWGGRLIAVNHGNLPGQGARLLQQRDVIDRVVCVSRLSYQAMAQVSDGLAPERLCHIPNAVAIPGVGCTRNSHPPRIGYAGRLANEKRAGDIAPFFRAVQQEVPHIEMWVAGKGELTPAMLELAREFPGTFRYCGELDRAELGRDFYPQLDLLVHFSAAEAWGYSLAEAMSFGVVPVTSAFRGLSSDQVVYAGENGLVFPIGDVVRAANLAARLFKDPALKSRLSAAAQAHIRNDFSLEKFGDRWARTLEEALTLPALPIPPRPTSLDARGPLGLPWRLWERLRRALGRRIPHASAGEEWPHFHCTDAGLQGRMAAALAGLEGGKDD